MKIAVAPRRGRTLHELLTGTGVQVRSDCGGAGTCGKCRVRVSDTDGVRSVLSCQFHPGAPVLVDVVTNRGRMARARVMRVNPNLVLAADVGTTTLSLAAVDVRRRRVVARRDVLNPQVVFGADVMSRIGNARVMRRAGLEDVLARFADDHGVGRRPAVAVGNTVMMHFLLGRSPAGLGEYPYRSRLPMLRTIRGRTRGGRKVTVLPMLGSFVGADCTAAILASGMHRRRGLSLLVDAGTNGEVVLGNRERLLVCSTAAGPAFEGATLECGSLAQPGAIRSVSVRRGRLSVTTVGNRPPLSMCGSGVLDAVAVGLSLRHIAVDGRLRRGRNRLELCGPDAYLSQADLREVQLAKGAIAAGIRLLLAEWKARAADLDAVFITGKFGAALSLTSAEAIGLLPQAPGAVVRQHGNLALKGAIQAAFEPALLREAENLAGLCAEVTLSGHPGFEEAFVRSMRFEPWS